MNRPVILLVIAVAIAVCAVPSEGISAPNNATCINAAVQECGHCGQLCLKCKRKCDCDCTKPECNVKCLI
ncbi:hypothetical protein ABFA07_004245 [Porites harrisoni]